MSIWPPDKCPICGHDDIVPHIEVKDHSISNEIFHIGKCGHCGFNLTVDAPDYSSIGKYYHSDVYISHSDTRSTLTDRLYHIARTVMIRKKRKLVNRSAAAKGQLLDIGSGTGYFLNAMAHSGWKATGIEVDDEARAISQKKFNIEVSSEFDPKQYESNTLDVITMWHVLEHVHDLNQYWKNFHSLLKSGGALILALPNNESLDALYYETNWAAWDVPRHLWHFRSKDISALASKHGFTVAEQISMPLDAYYVSILSEKYKNPTGSSLFKGLLRGLISNIRAKEITDYSSIIYVLRKK